MSQFTNKDAIARAKARLAANPADASSGKGGLGVPLHPLLRGISNPIASKKVLNKRGFDAFQVNPYLNDLLQGKKRPRGLQFNRHGKYIEQGNELREQLRIEKQQQEELDQKKKLGLIPLETLGEDTYQPEVPPLVEWWDQPYLKLRKYTLDDLILDAESSPISIYVQHPPLMEPTWTKHLPEEKPMFLTKKEQKRIRRNDRLLKSKDKQDRIKLGLDAPPPPKVKLSNLMSVLTNEATSDPTAVELRVKLEIQQRLEKHEKENEERKLTQEQRHEKIAQQQEKDLEKGYFTTVYKIDNLGPKEIYKLDINAKQLGLFGVCLLNPRLNLVVVEGGAKGIKFYKRLVMARLARDPEVSDPEVSASTLIWEGQLKELTFKRWSVNKTSTDQEAIDFLGRFGLESYWRVTEGSGRAER